MLITLAKGALLGFTKMKQGKLLAFHAFLVNGKN
jgi:hypothetical protein